MAEESLDGRKVRAGARKGVPDGEEPMADRPMPMVLDIAPGTLGSLTPKAKEVLRGMQEDGFWASEDSAKPFIRHLYAGNIRTIFFNLGVMTVAVASSDPGMVQRGVPAAFWNFLSSDGFPPWRQEQAVQCAKRTLVTRPAGLDQVTFDLEGISLSWQDGNNHRLGYRSLAFACALAEFFFNFDSHRFRQFLEEIWQHAGTLVVKETRSNHQRLYVCPTANVTGIAYGAANELNQAIHVRSDGRFGEYFLDQREMVRRFVNTLPGCKELADLSHEQYYQFWETHWQVKGFKSFDTVVRTLARQQAIDRFLERLSQGSWPDGVMEEEPGDEDVVYVSDYLTRQMEDLWNPYQRLGRQPASFIKWIKNIEEHDWLTELFGCRPLSDEMPLLILEMLLFGTRDWQARIPREPDIMISRLSAMADNLDATRKASIHWLLMAGKGQGVEALAKILLQQDPTAHRRLLQAMKTLLPAGSHPDQLALAIRDLGDPPGELDRVPGLPELLATFAEHYAHIHREGFQALNGAIRANAWPRLTDGHAQGAPAMMAVHAYVMGFLEKIAHLLRIPGKRETFASHCQRCWRLRQQIAAGGVRPVNEEAVP